MEALGWSDREVGWDWGAVSWEQAVGELGEGVELGNCSTSAPHQFQTFNLELGEGLAQGIGRQEEWMYEGWLLNRLRLERRLRPNQKRTRHFFS